MADVICRSFITQGTNKQDAMNHFPLSFTPPPWYILEMADDYKSGLGFGIGAYTIWGILPIYFYALSCVSPYEVVCHRIFWSAVFLGMILVWRGKIRETLAELRQRKTLLSLATAGTLISVNWLIYIYAVGNGMTIDASLGYFINPVIIILFGFLFFGERLNGPQKICTGFAVVGVVYQILQSSTFSWISLALPITFGFYGVIKKRSSLGSIAGLFIETLCLAPLAFLYMGLLASQGSLAFFNGTPLEIALLAVAGVITAIPLLLFAEGAKRVPYNIMGFLQYIAPSAQFLLGLYAFHELLDFHKLVGFVLVWIGLLILILTELQKFRRSPRYASH